MLRANGRPACICRRLPEARATISQGFPPATVRSAVRVAPERRSRSPASNPVRDILVRTLIDPGFSLVALAVLLEPVQQFADPAAEEAASAGAAEHPAQIAQQAAQGLLTVAALQLAAASALEKCCQ